FMSFTGADSDRALQFLELTNWTLSEAVNLYMESGEQSASSTFSEPQNSGSTSTRAVGAVTSNNNNIVPPPAPMDDATAAAIAAAYGDEEDGVRAPDPSMRQRLLESEMDFLRPLRHLRDQNRDFAAESIAAMTSGSAGLDGGTAADRVINNDRTRDLSALFQPPTAIMFPGTYADARTQAKNENKWLLVNIQDEIVFASHMLNRDTWSDDVVQNLVASGFVFWQSYWVAEHGKKFCTLYQIARETLPVIIIIDPRTGEIRQRWSGFLEPQDLTEKLSDFCCMHTVDSPSTEQKKEAVEPNIMDASEDDQVAAAIAASMQNNSDEGEANHYADIMEEKDEEQAQEPIVALSPEPEVGAPGVTRIQIRVPDGSRLTRRFLKSDPLAMVWSFVKEQVPEARGRAFELRTAFPPSAVAYNDTLSIVEGKLENASLMVKWL
ncbi:UBX domain-containing protein 7, partial [Phytophthora boehmeriae]